RLPGPPEIAGKLAQLAGGAVRRFGHDRRDYTTVGGRLWSAGHERTPWDRTDRSDPTDPSDSSATPLCHPGWRFAFDRNAKQAYPRSHVKSGGAQRVLADRSS